MKTLILCFSSLLLVVIALACSATAEEAFENNEGVVTIQLPNAPRNYCASLDTVNVTNDSTELYGAICAISSEDGPIQDSNLSLSDRLKNCQYLFLHKDGDPFADSLILNAASLVTNFFEADDLQDLRDFLDGSSEGITDPPTWASGSTQTINENATIRIKDFKNRPVLLVTVFAADDDSITDDVYYNQDNADTDYTNDYPIIKAVYDTDIPLGGSLNHSQTLVIDGQSTLTFNYTFSRGECP